MSLNFANTSTADRVACGSAAALDNWTACSFVAWIYPTASPGTDIIERIGSKADSTSGNGKNFSFATHTALSLTDGLNFRINRATAAATASGPNNMSLNIWHFVAGTYDETTGPQLFRGDLSTLVAEVTYTNGPTVGSGGSTSEANGALWWGNREYLPATGLGFRGRIGRSMYINRLLTLADLRRLQFAPVSQWSNFTEYKATYEFYSTGHLQDISGNGNAGAITGDVTNADHVPLGPPFGFGLGWQGAFTAAAAGRTTKNTRSWPLGVEVGMGWRMPA